MLAYKNKYVNVYRYSWIHKHCKRTVQVLCTQPINVSSLCSILQYLSLPPIIAPYKCSVLPLSNNTDFNKFVSQVCKYKQFYHLSTSGFIFHDFDFQQGIFNVFFLFLYQIVNSFVPSTFINHTYTVVFKKNIFHVTSSVFN